jgi:hypothetical protein
MEKPVDNSASKTPDTHPCDIKGWSTVTTFMAEHDAILWIC